MFKIGDRVILAKPTLAFNVGPGTLVKSMRSNDLRAYVEFGVRFDNFKTYASTTDHHTIMREPDKEGYALSLDLFELLLDGNDIMKELLDK